MSNSRSAYERDVRNVTRKRTKRACDLVPHPADALCVKCAVGRRGDQPYRPRRKV